MDKFNVAILGAGNGGLATAGDFANNGFRVNLFELPEFEENLRPIRDMGGINVEVLESSGRKAGFAKLQSVTTDIREALKDAEFIMVIVPSFAHKRFARICAPHLSSGQVVVLSPGNFGGAIQWAQEINTHGKKDILIGEAESMIYAARKKSPDTIWIRGYKRSMRAAALPAKYNKRLMYYLRELYPDMEEARNVLETSLSNPNPVIHTPIMLMNAGLLERTEGDFLFYHDGMTPVIGRVVETIDSERLRMAGALGLNNVRSIYEQDLAWYSHQGTFGNNIHDTTINNPIYRWSKAPGTFDHRYLTEDIPYGLGPMESLGKWLDIPTPAMTATVEYANIATGRNLREESRSIEYLGLNRYTPEELMGIVNEEGFSTDMATVGDISCRPRRDL